MSVSAATLLSLSVSDHGDGLVVELTWRREVEWSLSSKEEEKGMDERARAYRK